MASRLLNGRHDDGDVQPFINNARKMPSAEAALRDSLSHSLLREIKCGKIYLKVSRNNINI